MMSSPVISRSPTFNNYSSKRLAEVAARLVEECRSEADYDGGSYDYGFSNPILTDFEESLGENRIHSNFCNENNGDEDDEEENEEEFEFAVVGRDFISSPSPADEIFYDGQIWPCFPLFNQDLLLEVEVKLSDEKVRRPPATAERMSLRKLFMEDREPPSLSSSCSFSEAEELDGFQPGSYCVWNPKTAALAAEEAR